MLYGKRPHLGNLREWGSEVWVHTTEGTKLDGRSKIGKWVGFDEISNGHRIYWPDKCSVTVECSIKSANGDMIIMSIPVVQSIQGEKVSRNLQNDSKAETEIEKQTHIKDNQQIPETSTAEIDNTPETQDQWKCTPFNRVTDELVAARSR